MYSLRAIIIPLWSYLFRVCDLQLCAGSALSHGQRFSSSLEGLSHQHQLSAALCGDGGVPVKAGVLGLPASDWRSEITGSVTWLHLWRV